MKTLEDFLRNNAKLYPDKTAAVCGNESILYCDLYKKAKQESLSLKKTAESNGRFIILRASQSINFLIKYFAIHMCNCIAVPLEKDIPQEKEDDIRRQLSSADIPDDVADILYTTGTTGKSKGVMISQRTIVSNAENLIDAQGFTHDINFLICGPLNHIGSLSKIFPTILVGGTIHIIEGMKDLNVFFGALDYPCDKFATFLVPASISILLHLDLKRFASYAGKLDFIETGAAPMNQSDMKTLCSILPNTRLYNTYASTETGIIATYDFNNNECIAGCLGKAMKHSSFFITENGNVACKGATLMSGYAGDEELTRQIMHDDTIFTSDIGEIDEKGRLHLKGREDDIINIGGFKVAPSEIENAAMLIPSIKECVCVEAKHPVIGNVLKLIVVMNDNESFDKKAIARFIHSKVESYKVPVYYEQADKIARTYNGKTDRKYYKDK